MVWHNVYLLAGVFYLLFAVWCWQTCPANPQAGKGLSFKQRVAQHNRLDRERDYMDQLACVQILTPRARGATALLMRGCWVFAHARHSVLFGMAPWGCGVAKRFC